MRHGAEVERIKAPILLTWIIGTSALLSAQKVPDYWPLEVGNRWVYSHNWNDGGDDLHEEITLEVLTLTEVHGQTYSALSNGQLLRKDETGNIWALVGDEEFLVFDLRNLDDPEYDISLAYIAFPPRNSLVPTYFPKRCTRANDKGELYTTTLSIGTFPTICFITGELSAVASVVLAENIGPVLSRRSTDLPGRFNFYELVQYRIGGNMYPTALKRASWAEIKQ